MLKEFLMKQAINSQLKNVPEEQKQMILKLVENNPDFFISLAKEIEEGVKAGRDQMAVAMEVMKKHSEEIKKIVG
jgi:hypothetical protein